MLMNKAESYSYKCFKNSDNLLTLPPAFTDSLSEDVLADRW